MLDQAIQFLVDGGETEAANQLRSCSMENWDIVDNWMDGNRQLDGVLIEIACPRRSYEILTDSSHPLTKSVEQALQAVLPSRMYLKGIRVRAIASSNPATTPASLSLGEPEIKELTQAIEAQRALMIAVATGGPRINEVKREYEQKRLEIKEALLRLGISNTY